MASNLVANGVNSIGNCVAFELSGRDLRKFFTKSDESVVINFVAAAFPNDAVERELWTTLFCA